MSQPESDRTPPAESDLGLALRMADTADQISLARYRASDLVVTTKPDLTPVTEADQAVERELRAILMQARPLDAVIGEEFGESSTHLPWSPADSRERPLSEASLTDPLSRCWVIDPIDATKNYVRGVPVWATLIALIGDGAAVLGVVSAPALGRRWWGQLARGSWTSGPEGERRIVVSDVDRIADASFSFSDAVGWAPGQLTNITEQAWRTRAYGDFWSHLLVAEGAVDIAAEPELNIWDIAALIPIVTAAGGQVTGYDGSDPLTAGSALTTNRRLHGQALNLLAKPTIPAG